MPKITLLGLGATGAALANTYIENGYTVTVWNRTASKADALVSKGASLAPTVSDALEASDLTLLCLLDNASVRETLDTTSAPLKGKTLINLTNGTPSHAREAAHWAKSQGAVYIHGGIMAVPQMIGSAHAVLLYSGESSDVFDAVAPHLAYLGTAKFLGSDAGAASLTDVALLAGMYGLFSGFLHATALVKSQGTTAGAFLELLVPWLAAMTGYLAPLAGQIDKGEYATQGSNLGMQVVGMRNIVAASEVGVASGFITLILERMERALRGGHAGADVSAVIEFMNVEKK
ncbi:hypothetical protein BJX64DRAFT_275537 [Aspergillus heterothallicus]